MNILKISFLSLVSISLASKPAHERFVSSANKLALVVSRHLEPDVYDKELQNALKLLHDAPIAAAATEILDDEKLTTVLDLAGTFQQIKTTEDAKKIAALTAKWYVIGRANASFEAFENGLSALGTTFDNLFKVVDSPVGSNKAVTESLVLSRWRDYVQDIEEGEEAVELNDVLFFTTGCKVLPARKIYPTIEFLHDFEEWGEKSRFPKSNACSAILRLPVVHSTYDEFKADMDFAIQNGRGFGLP
ncbi:G2 M phase-specific E3 ubiquitin- ligase-like [Paramuricea clavata]|uniref:G2 M phase-specific E3 ubiquitin- ligase-like n=1 Tax=Paramuricea clavata TaxID=317549 RepID=A0A6S7I420_PARCT|nr:G2 M phase-specific E3 ubiquitin- ligase-like [Paramuricea clavata]